MNTQRRILKIEDLLNPLPEDKSKKTKVVLHHSFNEVLRLLRKENPEDKKKKRKRTLKTKIQSSNKPKKRVRFEN